MHNCSSAVALISFDLDGTLVDTAGEIAEAVNRALDDAGLPRRSLEEITGLIGKGARELMLRLLASVLPAPPFSKPQRQVDALLASFERHYGDTAGRFARPYAGCAETLARLRSSGLQLVCVTNKEQRHAERVLEATGLARHFDLLVGGDTLAVKKPDAGVLHHVLARYGVPAETAAHVGDSAIDVECARRAGVAAWALPHGYNAGVPIANAHPDRLFADLPAVADFVCGPMAAQNPQPAAA